MNFKDKVFEVARKIPRGKVLTYKEVTEKAGKPNAWRAVGNILNKNRNPKVFCHRVVRSDMRVGGYYWGTKNKIGKLKKEGVKIINKKVIIDEK